MDYRILADDQAFNQLIIAGVAGMPNDIGIRDNLLLIGKP